MTGRRFRDISTVIREGRESEIDEGELAEYNRVKDDLARSASRMSTESLPSILQTKVQAAQDIIEASQRSGEAAARGMAAKAAAHRAEWERQEAARQVSRDQLDAMKDVLSEVQAQRLEAAENAKSSSTTNGWVLFVSSIAALAAVVGVVVSIIALQKG